MLILESYESWFRHPYGLLCHALRVFNRHYVSTRSAALRFTFRSTARLALCSTPATR